MARVKKDKDMKGISRIDSKGTHGWFVRVYRNGKTYSKLYSDNKYGGKDRALKIARKARDYALATIPVLPKSKVRKRRLSKSTKRNKSGVVGVNRTKKTNRSGTVSEYYQVTWSPEIGVTKNKQWSIKKYGEEGAFELAWQFRQNVMKEIYGERYVPDNDIVERPSFEEAEAALQAEVQD